MNVLHFSLFNTVNVPLTWCEVYRQREHNARLLTLYKHRGGIAEDMCLYKRPYDPTWLRYLRRNREERSEAAIETTRNSGRAFRYEPANPVERLIISVRDSIRSVEFRRLVQRYGLYDFDVYHFHGGIGYFRDSRWIRALWAADKPIIVHYHGPDLRSRGVVDAVDRASSLNLTNEYDLLGLHPDLQYIPIPFDASSISPARPRRDRLLIVHTPSVPAAKGTHLIEPVFRRLASERRVDYLIRSGISHEEVMAVKREAGIAVEQIGNFGGTGYGVNSLETLAMQIPTVTEFTPEYNAFLKGHPFVLADRTSLYDRLVELVDNENYRQEVGRRGREWLLREHEYDNVWRKFVQYLSHRCPDYAEKL